LKSENISVDGTFEDRVEKYSWHIFNNLKKKSVYALEQYFIYDFYNKFFDKYCYEGLNKLAESVVSKTVKFEPNVTQNLVDTFFVMNLDGEVNNSGFSQFFYNGNIAKYLVVEQAIKRIKPQPYLEIYTRLMTEIRNWSQGSLEKFYEDGIFHDNNKESILLANKINEFGGSIPFLKKIIITKLNQNWKSYWLVIWFLTKKNLKILCKTRNKSISTLQNRENYSKKLIILDLKIFTILMLFWLLFLFNAFFNYNNFKDTLPILFFIGVSLSIFYYLFFTFTLVIQFKQKFRLWYFVFSLFIVTPILFLFL
jgi:hypothetical protein